MVEALGALTSVTEAPARPPFYIAARGGDARRVLKHGDAFAIFDAFGDLGTSPAGEDGLFYRDTRHLSHLALTLNGMRPLLLGSTVRDDNAVLDVDLTNPDIYFDQRLVLAKDTLHIVRSVFLWEGTAYQRIALRNFGDDPVDVTLVLSFSVDFSDLFEVRGMRRARRGSAEATCHDGRVEFAYRGLDGKLRTTRLDFCPAPDQLGTSVAAYALALDAGKSTAFVFSASCASDPTVKPVSFSNAVRTSIRANRLHSQDFATIETSNDIVNEVLRRSAADLQMLITRTDEGPYPYAGVPWFSTTFGRDGLITAMELLWCCPSLARGVLRRLAARQATRFDAVSDAEPGKILHEMRSGEMAALHEVPFELYYGSVDSTPLFVMLACLYAERTGDDETLLELWPHIEAALAWMDGPADCDQDGFVEYQCATEEGLVNQGWKDSHDSIFHADGRLAEGPIALCEVQGYVHCARRLAARSARRLGRPDFATHLEARAKRLAEDFDRAFWMEDLGLYALALDGRKRPCAVKSSNAGHALFSGIARPDRAKIVAARLMDPGFFSGWGIRTLATSETRYNPMSYHNGSVWPHDNAMIALGFARYALKDPIERVLTGMFDAAIHMDLRRLPELFCGFPRRRGRGPTLYPVACSPQAWAAATPFALVQATLGLKLEAAERRLIFRNPRLPPCIDEMTIRNLQLAGSRVDIGLRRHGKEVSVRVVSRQSEVQVSAIYAGDA